MKLTADESRALGFIALLIGLSVGARLLDRPAPIELDAAGVMNLTSEAASRAALVGVASLEVPTLQRVTAGNPNDSYLIRKLEGTPGIVGSRMPLVGPPLPQATIDSIRLWITNGAQ